MDVMAQTGTRGRFPAGQPNDFGSDGVVGGVPAIAGEQPHLRFSSQTAPMLPECLQQLGAEHEVAVLATLSALYVNHHSLAVNVANLQMREFGPAHSGRIERHQDRAIERSRCGVDEPRDLLRAEYLGQPDDSLRVRSFVNTPSLLECLDEEKPQCTDSLVDGVRGQLSFTEQVGLVLADVLRAQRVRGLLEVAGEILDRHEVRPYGIL